MKKNTITKITIFLVNMLFLVYGYIAVHNEELGFCQRVDGGGVFCFPAYNSYIDPLMFSGLFYGAMSIILFFISDAVFKKWTTFAIIWFVLDVIFIAIAPEYSGYYFGGPTKELVSIWMGVLFVIISLAMFVVLTIKEKKNLSR